MEPETESSPSVPAPSSPKKSFPFKAALFGLLVLLAFGVGSTAFWYSTRSGPEPSPTLMPSPTGTPSETPTSTKTPILTPAPTPALTPTPVVFQVTSVAVVSPTTATTCPAPTKFNFTGVIVANAAGTATYQWERSDGASTPIKTVVFDAAGSKTVTDTWMMATGGTHWEKVHVLTPNDISSNKAIFIMVCLR